MAARNYRMLGTAVLGTFAVLACVILMQSFDAVQDREDAARWEKVAHEQSDAMRHLSEADAKLKAACMTPAAK
jgi:hypothetical protein